MATRGLKIAEWLVWFSWTRWSVVLGVFCSCCRSTVSPCRGCKAHFFIIKCSLLLITCGLTDLIGGKRRQLSPPRRMCGEGPPRGGGALNEEFAQGFTLTAGQGSKGFDPSLPTPHAQSLLARLKGCTR